MDALDVAQLVLLVIVLAIAAWFCVSPPPSLLSRKFIRRPQVTPHPLYKNIHYVSDTVIRKTKKNSHLYTAELDMLKELQGEPHVAKLVRMEKCVYPYIFLERYPSDLFDVISRENFTLATGILLAINMTKAVQSLHQIGIAHGDLKVENFCVRHDNSVVLIDFEFSYFFVPGVYKRGGMNGTVEYMTLNKLRQDLVLPEKCDLWALGITLFCMFFKTHPYSTYGSYMEVARAIEDTIENRETFWKKLPPSYLEKSVVQFFDQIFVSEFNIPSAEKIVILLQNLKASFV